jgi:hypothetical protein
MSEDDYKILTADEIERAFARALREHDRQDHAPRKMKKEFSKLLMIFAAGLCAATWVAAAISWFLWREFPAELTQYTIWFFGAAMPSYMLKTGYENKPKIEGRREGSGK